MPEAEYREALRAGLAAAVEAACGGAELTEIDRLRGGSKKGVYRLGLGDGRAVVAYVWNREEDFWPEAPVEDAGPLGHASGLGLFAAANRRLTGLGVRTPELLLADDAGRFLPQAELAIVEDVPGESLEALLGRDPAAARPVLEQLRGALRLMAADTAPRPGRIGHGTAESCERLVLRRALADLAEAAGRDGRIAEAEGELADRLHRLARAVRPRSEFGLVHGELGPDHVLVDAAGRPVLIDIEGLMHFDVEWEHVFLRIRFDEHYGDLAAEGLDPDRLAFYELAMRLSLVAGPLRLLDGGFPDREFMLGIVEYNLRAALAGQS
ncbi:phosphotransferase [Kitasatospora sp. NPDC002227]|uniref:phosphotransferase n=1 Tax=Kitasatospora sp. NPDC002227 TaxID=3154773 RepID=UPI003323604D